MKIDSELMIEASFGENFFAPKCIDRDKNFDIRNAHAIANTRCNFKCAFCKNGVESKVVPHYRSLKEYSDRIDKIIEKGKMFKFTGGEPCMNPNLEILMKIVKERGGIIFLDTNGSMHNLVENYLNQNLIDVLGISLKGLTPEEAMQTSGVKNKKLCWDNPLLSIKEASKRNNVRVIVTYVAYDDFKYEQLCQFSNILSKLGNNIYLKINNLCGDLHRNNNIKPVEQEVLIKIIEKFVKENQEWKNKIILINSSGAVTDYSKILFY